MGFLERATKKAIDRTEARKEGKKGGKGWLMDQSNGSKLSKKAKERDEKSY